MKACFLIAECSLSYAKIMQTSAMKACFLIAECSLSYAKIALLSEKSQSIKLFYKKVRGYLMLNYKKVRGFLILNYKKVRGFCLIREKVVTFSLGCSSSPKWTRKSQKKEDAP